MSGDKLGVTREVIFNSGSNGPQRSATNTELLSASPLAGSQASIWQEAPGIPSKALSGGLVITCVGYQDMIQDKTDGEADSDVPYNGAKGNASE